MELERVPDYWNKSNPKCPDCDERVFYVGERIEYAQGNVVKAPVYQYGTCRRLYKGVR